MFTPNNVGCAAKKLLQPIICRFRFGKVRLNELVTPEQQQKSPIFMNKIERTFRNEEKQIMFENPQPISKFIISNKRSSINQQPKSGDKETNNRKKYD